MLPTFMSPSDKPCTITLLLRTGMRYLSLLLTCHGSEHHSLMRTLARSGAGSSKPDITDSQSRPPNRQPQPTTTAGANPSTAAIRPSPTDSIHSHSLEHLSTNRSPLSPEPLVLVNNQDRSLQLPHSWSPMQCVRPGSHGSLLCSCGWSLTIRD